MYRLLIVDDEKFEREGMANLIPWNKYGVELAGTAWNGIEGLQIIEKERPEIVITDIKMPVLDGIGLIKKVKANFPEIEFIVLSGYGEYEFTSQAMEQGVRHYILKPCDEEKIVQVLDKVKSELDAKKQKQQMEKQYQNTMNTLLPRAREHLFRNMLLGREQIKAEYQLFLEELGKVDICVAVLAFRSHNSFDYLEQFILWNILQELLGENNILLSTSVQEEVMFLLTEKSLSSMENAVNRTMQEFEKFGKKEVWAAVSKVGKIDEVNKLYIQIEELFRINELNQEKGILHYGTLNDIQSDATALVNYKALREAIDYEQILFELYLIFIKMDLKGYSYNGKVQLCRWALKILYGNDEFDIENEKIEEIYSGTDEEKSQKLMICLTDIIMGKKGYLSASKKEEEKYRNMLAAVYQHLADPEMSIQFLAKNILFMNEDYFGRVFTRSRKEKFSSYLLNTRITIAKRLMQYDPEIKISQLAVLTGFSADGQYFSKAFKKVTGITPTEFKERI